MLNKIKEFVKENKDEMIKDIISLVKIESIEDFSDPEYPFGIGNHKCLEITGKICKKLGFSWTNMDGYAGFSDFGKADKMLGILGHNDIVPIGKGWTEPPLEGIIKDGKLIGRGVLDDKGPMIACLYAAKALKDSGFKPNSAFIRFIFGTNEETGWKGINYYLDNEKEPDLGFTPDGEFPIIQSEKGMLGIKLNFKNNSKILKGLFSGERQNIVPSRAVAIIDFNKEEIEKYISLFNGNISIISENELESEEKEYFKTIDGTIILAKGKSAHASLPHLGDNAISELCLFLSEIDKESEFLNFYKTNIKKETNGKTIGVYSNHNISGELTFNCGIIRSNKDNIELTIDMRFPMSTTAEKIKNTILEKAKEFNKNVELIEKASMEPLLVEDEFLLSNLKEAYETVTGEESKLLAIGGGTYAKAVKNTVAFGPLFPGREECAHQPDEHMYIDDIINMTEIYAYAMYLLTK